MRAPCAGSLPVRWDREETRSTLLQATRLTGLSGSQQTQARNTGSAIALRWRSFLLARPLSRRRAPDHNNGTFILKAEAPLVVMF
ncbi:unnamed protein product [Gadus morhua 'NCC']